MLLSDFSAGMVQAARWNLHSSPGRFAFAILDAQEIPFESGIYEAVVANHMLFHVADRQKAIQEIRRVLKPGGRLYATTIGPQHMVAMENYVSRVDPEAARWTKQLRKSFNLENGREELANLFPSVDVRLYEDSLVITEAQPLIAYLFSVARFQDPATEQNQLSEFIQSIKMEIEKEGAIFIPKETGILVAEREC